MALGSAPSACGALPAISTALAPRQHQRLVRLGGGRLLGRLRTAGGHAVALEQRANLLARLLGFAVTVLLLRDQRGHLLADGGYAWERLRAKQGCQSESRAPTGKPSAT